MEFHMVTRVIELECYVYTNGIGEGLWRTKREGKTNGIQLPWSDCTAERANHLKSINVYLSKPTYERLKLDRKG
jgi:hypothetical protein